MHQTRNSFGMIDIAIKVNTLNQGRSAITDADDCNASFSVGQVGISLSTQQRRYAGLGVSCFAGGSVPPLHGPAKRQEDIDLSSRTRHDPINIGQVRIRQRRSRHCQVFIDLGG